MNSVLCRSMRTLMLLFAWTFMDSASYLLSHSYDRSAWNQFWTKIQNQNSPAGNLLSSCPWDYVQHPDNSVHAQIFPFAIMHCIDLYKSRADGPVYDPYGECRPIRAHGCGSVIVGYTCVHHLKQILVNRRNSYINNTFYQQSTTAIETTPSLTDLPTSSSMFVNDKSEKPDKHYSDITDEKLDKKDELSGTHTAEETHTVPLQQFRVPPFFNGARNQPNLSPLFSPNQQQTGPPNTFFGSHNPQLGMPPNARPSSLLQMINGRHRTSETETSSEH